MESQGVDSGLPADKNEWLDLLKRDPASFFAAARKVHFREVLDLSGLDFSGLDLSEAPYRRRWDLSGSNLAGCRVSVAHLSMCRLNGTCLDGIQGDESVQSLEQIAALWSGADAWNT